MRTRSWAFVVAGLLVTLLLASVVSHWASADPDGLNKVAAEKGFDDSATEHDSADGPFAGYTAKAVDDPWLAGATAGAVGVALCFTVAGAMALVTRRRPPDSSGQEDSL